MLIKATINDFDFFFSMYMHPQINPYLLYEMMSEDSFKPIFTELIKDEVLYKYVEDEKVVGMCKLIFLKYRNHHMVYLGGFAVNPSYAGNNYGYKMLQHIIAYVKTQNKSRIELSVSIENEKARNLYKKAGFVEEGILKKYTHLASENRFIDEVLMGYLY
jgi:L-phenylalanine/L-methionine N-acetyltransferase